MQQNTGTSKSSTAPNIAEQLTLFREASPASHTAQQESDLERMTNATCGPKCLELFGKLNRNGLWAKTFAGLLVGQTGWFSKKCALIWKLRGTKSNRSYFLLQALVHPTLDTESGLLPTPVKGNARSGATSIENGRMKRKLAQGWTIELHDLARLGLLPTPTKQDAKNSTLPPSQKNRDSIPGSLLTNGYTGQLNPLFVEEMMGFPIGWTELPPLETP